MSSASTIVVAVSGLYLAACLLLGMLPGKKASGTAAGYVAGDRTLGLFVMYFIMGATIFSAFAFLGGPGWAYSRGAAAFYILGYGALGFLPFYFLGPRAARLGRRYGFVTQAEMVAGRYGRPPIAGVMALISVAAFIPYLALQMKGAGLVLNSVTGGAIAEWVGSAVVYGIVLIYVLKSGVLGVGWTNTFQGIFMMVLAWGLGLYLPWVLYGGVGPMFESLARERPELLTAPGLTSGGQPWTWGEYSSSVIVSILGFSVWPHLFMKSFTARDNRTIRRTVVLYPTFQIFLVPLFFIGFAGVMFGSTPDKPDQILTHMLMNMEIPPILVGLFCAGALAASMSSGDAMAHAAASIGVRDGLVRGAGRHFDGPSERRMIRYLVIGVMVVAYVVAVRYQGDLVPLLLMAYGWVVQFAPGVVASLYLRWPSGNAVLAGLLAGFAVTLLFVQMPEWRPFPVHAGLYGLVVNVATIVLVTLVAGGGASARDREFLAVARGDARSAD